MWWEGLSTFIQHYIEDRDSVLWQVSVAERYKASRGLEVQLAGRRWPFCNRFPGQFLITQLHMPHLSPEERHWSTEGILPTVSAANSLLVPQRGRCLWTGNILLCSFQPSALSFLHHERPLIANPISRAPREEHRHWQANKCKALVPRHVPKWHWVDPRLPDATD